MKKKIKREHRHVDSMFAIGVIFVTSFVVGLLVWLGNKDYQASENQYLTTFPMNNKPEISSSSIVFLGDSITAQGNWNALFGMPLIVNAGIPGNTTDDILARLDQITNAKPKKIFLMIGVNDFLRGKDVLYVLKNYKEIIAQIKEKSPATAIYMQSILPISNDLSRIGTIDASKIVMLNAQIKSLSNGKNIFFIDLHDSFCGDDQKLYTKYTIDGVHLSVAGYNLWKESLVSYLK